MVGEVGEGLDVESPSWDASDHLERTSAFDVGRWYPKLDTDGERARWTEWSWYERGVVYGWKRGEVSRGFLQIYTLVSHVLAKKKKVETYDGDG